MELFDNCEWFSLEQTGIRQRNNRYEVNCTQGKQKIKYIGRFETLEIARQKRKEFYINLFIKNLETNGDKVDNLKEISSLKNYFVSKNGQIYNKFGNRLEGMIDHCGYREINIKGKNYLVHRLVMKEFLPVLNQDRLDVNHKDGNKTNNSLNNLEWCTRSENIKHSFANGLQNNIAGRPIVTANKRLEFLDYRNKGYTYKQISQLTGFNEKTIIKHINKLRKER